MIDLFDVFPTTLALNWLSSETHEQLHLYVAVTHIVHRYLTAREKLLSAQFDFECSPNLTPSLQELPDAIDPTADVPGCAKVEPANRLHTLWTSFIHSGETHRQNQ
jgi:hypothetical protein